MRVSLLALPFALLLVACSDESPSTPADPDATAADVISDNGSGGDAVGTPDSAAPDTTTSDAATPDGSTTPDAAPTDTVTTPDATPDVPVTPGDFCPPLDPPTGDIIDVSPGDNLASVIYSAPANSTVRFADGNYDVSGYTVQIINPGITLRSASGDPASVVLDGGYSDTGNGEVFLVNADDVTIADMTIQRARYHAIHVQGSGDVTTGSVIYNVVIIDPGEQAIKINRDGNGNPADNGLVACSTLTMTAAGRAQVESQTSSGSNCYTGGVDAHAARDWVVRDNVITGFWCSVDLSEHGIHFWRGSRDTLVERNLLINNARGVGFGLTTGGNPRTYSDNPCGGGARDHYGGIVRNNIIIGTEPGLFASNAGMDGGIAFAIACDSTAIHNTIASTQPMLSSIEFRFPETNSTLVNNLATGRIWQRNDATSVEAGNIMEIGTDWFVDLDAFDGHLSAAAAAAVDGGVTGYENLVPTDFDGDPRDGSPDVGADEL